MNITVFTPIYNRAYIIENLYQSLLRQTDKNFEWLVVDDGSTDNVEEICNEYNKKENGFPMRFYRKENGGKHTCINIGTDMAMGKYFFIVDSDDYLPDDAIETANKWINEIERSGDEKLIGIAGLKYNYVERKNIGNTFCKADNQYEGVPYIDCTSIERDKHGIFGDKAEIIRTDIICRYKFPVFENERFLTENCIWYPIAGDGYKLRWFNKAIYNAEYLNDGLTKNAGKNICIMGSIYATYILKKYNYNLRHIMGNLGAVANAIKANSDKDKYYRYAKEKLGWFWGSKATLLFCGFARKILKN